MAAAETSAPSPATNPEETFHCVACNLPDSIADLVQCDQCDQWWHQSCAGVTASIKDKPWTCRNCLPAECSKSDISHVSLPSKGIRLKLEQLAEKRALEKKALQIKLDAIQAELKMVDDKYKLLQAAANELDDNVSVRSRVSRTTSFERTTEWLDQISDTENTAGGPYLPGSGISPTVELNSTTTGVAKKKPIESTPRAIPSQVRQKKRKDRQQQRAEPKPFSEDDPNLSEQHLEEDGVLKLRPKRHHQPALSVPTVPVGRFREPVTETTGLPSHHPADPAKDVNNFISNGHSSRMQSMYGKPLPPPLIPENQGKPFANNCLSNDTLYEPHESLIKQLGSCPNEGLNFMEIIADYTPTTAQLAARQVMSRDLPTFDGNPADWPVFISTFTTTTLACGFNQTENLIRLQRALKGDALQSVRSRILVPNSVPRIIDTLRNYYGRPEQLMKVLLAKIKSIPAPKSDKLETLIHYGMAVQSFCDTLDAANQTSNFSNPSLLAELVDRLPSEYKMQWGSYIKIYQEVNLKHFAEFMSELMDSARRVTSYTGNSNRMEDRSKPKRGALHIHAEDNPEVETGERRCSVCSQNHRLKECDNFKRLSVDERMQVVQREKLCRNCLNFHGNRSCRVNGQCNVDGCKIRHHPLLHLVRGQQIQPVSSVATSQPSNSNDRSPPVSPSNAAYDNHVHRSYSQLCLFRIVPIVIYGSENRKIESFAFLDDGSSLTLVEEDLIRELGIQGEPQTLCLRWTGNMTRIEKASKIVELNISGINRSRFKLRDVRTVKALTLSQQTLNYQDLSDSFPHLRGLPISSYYNVVPRILIGLNNLRLTVPLSIKEGGPNEPVAANTRLGWCVYGGSTGSSLSVNIHSNGCSCDEALDTTVRNYFALEDVGVSGCPQVESESDKRSKQILEETTVRQNNRFQTGLLWRFDHYEFPDSRRMAEKRYECLERKLKRNPKMLQIVSKQMQEYQEKGYARLASKEELQKADSRKVWYLPLNVVINPKKPDKIRMVWDAAATVGGVSLNTMLMKGPDQLNKLPWVLFRFRQFAVAVSGDIAEMFHQIRIRPEDQQAQRFLWRTDPSKAPDVFIMQVATFGATCSPASAHFVKNKNALEYRDIFPRAVEEILECHYMDDYLGSFGSEEETEKIAKQVRTVHSYGGFNIRGWRSNSQKVLEGMGESTIADPRSLNLEHTDVERVLGMHWLPREDSLAYSTSFQPELSELIASKRRPTKRQVLRCLMSIFDPLGLLAAFVVQGKVLLQDIWRAGTLWDEEINDRANGKWTTWIEQFPLIAELRIPRCYYLGANNNTYRHLELHLFADASEDAYAAVAYFRIPNPAGGFRISLVAAKTKVAPLRHWSIPRLELQSAVLAARLGTFIKAGHKLRIERTVFWSDSSTVLAWIRSDHRRYSQFVACRVSEILSTTTIADWRWVPTKLNVADLATKWGQGGQLDVNGSWFHGPLFLTMSEENWPIQKSIQTTDLEQKTCNVHLSVFIPEPMIDPTRFSRWDRMRRAMAYSFRFVHNCRNPRAKSNSFHLKQEELLRAENYLFQTAQWSAFADEICTIMCHRPKAEGMHVPMDKKSKLYQLSPYLDENNVLRVDGRIGAAANASENLKFPVILPKKHPITNLFIDFYHRKYQHANFETVVNELRQVTHIPQARSQVKHIVKQCQYCKVYKARPQVPRMAPLPAARLASYTRPFTYVGLDLFGPILVKVGRTTVKRWIALFTCLTVRAIHVEVVFSLSTEACIMAIRRFTGRRGFPQEFYSDNGTNFRGANNVLQEQVRKIEEGLASTFTNTTTKWIFIPPGTPHMGGAWERMVRSVKTAMESSLASGRKLDDEGLWTLAVESESIVNSRPLTYLPLEAEESEALTPNHLLLGSSSGVKQPSILPLDEVLVLKNCWNKVQHQADMFWRRWVREYLPELTIRTKWLGETRPICVGDLVIIVDEAKRNGWVRGKINEVIQGQDGRIRKAIVQTHRGLIRQSVSKLAVLDVAARSNPRSD
ncbi:uncharacterized protein LOC129742446 [Uranotaenia lowii]|uniref:uncharacterized protein LOC129742446 n=1 Tax=Uranotaenia lowii TaxID=190385 RepID=UPI00247AD033|nr:uncharacterized protein LOC129742446 [Uranotaenia lowii]